MDRVLRPNLRTKEGEKLFKVTTKPRDVFLSTLGFPKNNVSKTVVGAMNDDSCMRKCTERRSGEMKREGKEERGIEHMCTEMVKKVCRRLRESKSESRNL